MKTPVNEEIQVPFITQVGTIDQLPFQMVFGSRQYLIEEVYV